MKLRYVKEEFIKKAISGIGELLSNTHFENFTKRLNKKYAGRLLTFPGIHTQVVKPPWVYTSCVVIIIYYTNSTYILSRDILRLL
jgi:hypothetical protein